MFYCDAKHSCISRRSSHVRCYLFKNITPENYLKFSDDVPYQRHVCSLKVYYYAVDLLLRISGNLQEKYSLLANDYLIRATASGCFQYLPKARGESYLYFSGEFRWKICVIETKFKGMRQWSRVASRVLTQGIYSKFRF